jgi:hypothetical protein
MEMRGKEQSAGMEGVGDKATTTAGQDRQVGRIREIERERERGYRAAQQPPDTTKRAQSIGEPNHVIDGVAEPGGVDAKFLNITTRACAHTQWEWIGGVDVESDA